jgi:SAM-dependent methyltransferase
MAQNTGTEEPPRLAWDAKYQSGITPWDTRITPPEVVAFWESHRLAPHGLALDLGCGPGTNSAYLAQLGLHAIGLEISGNALGLARRRHATGSLASHGTLEFIQADITRFPLAAGQAVYILDIGCLHGLPLEDRPAYAAGIIQNLRSGGYYHLYAFDRTPEQADLRGLLPDELTTLFTPHLTILEATPARPDRRPCHWYLLQRA